MAWANRFFAHSEFCSISASPAANTKIPPGPGIAPTIGETMISTTPSEDRVNRRAGWRVERMR